MNVKANWIKNLEKREQEIVLLRREQIIREGEVYQREQKLLIDQALLKEGFDALEARLKLNKERLDAMLTDAEAVGVVKGRAEERARSKILLDSMATELTANNSDLVLQQQKENDMLKGLLNTAIASLQANIKIERS